MPHLLRITFTAILFIAGTVFVRSQDFENLSPVIAKTTNKDSGTALLLNAAHMGRDVTRPYVNSVQIVEADQPWPPIWYTACPLYTGQMFIDDSLQNRNVLNFMLDAKVEGGYFSFFKLRLVGQDDSLISKPIEGYILLNKKMEPVDTVSCNLPSLYWHDFRINALGERLVDFKILGFLDLRKATGNSADSAVRSQSDVIHILDKNNKSIFSWRATDHLDPVVFQFNESLHSKSFIKNNSDGEFIDWSHLTSATWDYDGNILYALRFIGIGKISRTDGHVIWHIDFKDMPILLGKDTLQWYFPHDFNLLHSNDTSATYSLYSQGEASSNTPARAVIFEMNTKTNKITHVKYLNPELNYTGMGQGGCDYRDSSDYTFSYGVHELDGIAAENRGEEFEYRKHGGIHTIYQLPLTVFTYKVHVLENWPRPPRPVIVKKSGRLEAVGDMDEFTWYKLEGADNTIVTKVGTAKSIKPQNDANYCVVGKYGIGYSVSRIFFGDKNHTY